LIDAWRRVKNVRCVLPGQRRRRFVCAGVGRRWQRRQRRHTFDLLDNLVADCCDLLIQKVDMHQVLRNQKAVLRIHHTGERLLQERQFVAQAPLRQLSHRRRIRLTGNQCFQHPASRHPQDIGRNAGQFNVGILQHLLHPVDHPCALFDQCDAIAGQIAQVTLRLGWNEAGFQQAMHQQLGQPLGILDIGLAPGHMFDVLCVDQQHHNVALQQVVHRLPVLTRAFQGDVGHFPGQQPVDQLQQFVCHRAKGTDFLFPVPLLIDPHSTRYHRLLVHIQPGAPLVDLSHPSPPVCCIHHDECLVGFLIRKILMCVLMATVSGTSRNPGQPDTQTHGTNELSTFVPDSPAGDARSVQHRERAQHFHRYWCR
jgi:hypothetical protein